MHKVSQTRVLLVNPKMVSRRGVRLPLSLLALGAVLEGRYQYQIIDGNLDDNATETILNILRDGTPSVLAVTVMPGPQVAPAIRISRAVRQVSPDVPIVWGGYFPTLYPDSAINARYVDFVVRGQGEETLLELLEGADAGSLSHADPSALERIRGVTWKNGGQIIHNADRPFRPADQYPEFPYERLPNIDEYFRPSFMGSRTAVHQAAIGCRYRCAFCGVVSMFDGATQLSGPTRLEHALSTLRDKYHANAVQFYDHNFFDTEDNSIPTLEVLSRFALPWWCYARADTLANFSSETWSLIHKSRLRMAYIGAEASSDSALRNMKKGAKVEHTLHVAELCRAHDVVPEFSFVLGGPDDTVEEVEHTLEFIKKLKAVHPTCEIILYFYSPTPQRLPRPLRDGNQPAMPVLETYGPNGPKLPMTPEGWTEQPWIDYVCHQDAPWLTQRVKDTVRGFSTVLYSRFPTIQDTKTPHWGKQILKTLASWRYGAGWYRNPFELNFARRLIPIRVPQRESI